MRYLADPQHPYSDRVASRLPAQEPTGSAKRQACRREEYNLSNSRATLQSTQLAKPSAGGSELNLGYSVNERAGSRIMTRNPKRRSTSSLPSNQEALAAAVMVAETQHHHQKQCAASPLQFHLPMPQLLRTSRLPSPLLALRPSPATEPATRCPSPSTNQTRNYQSLCLPQHCLLGCDLDIEDLDRYGTATNTSNNSESLEHNHALYNAFDSDQHTTLNISQPTRGCTSGAQGARVNSYFLGPNPDARVVVEGTWNWIWRVLRTGIFLLVVSWYVGSRLHLLKEVIY